MSTTHGHAGDGGHSSRFSGTITPEQSLFSNALTAGCLSLIPAALTWYLLNWTAWWIWLPACLVVIGYVGPLLMQMSSDATVQPGSVGVGTLLDRPVPLLYTPGTHKRLPKLEGMIMVETKPKELDPEPIDQLTAEEIPVTVDGFFLRSVSDPLLWLSVGGPDKDHALMEQFESEIRMFISPWRSAKALVGMRNLLGDFLRLTNPRSKEAHELRAKFDELTELENPPLTREDVDHIWERVGKFCRTAAEWGIDITDIKTEDLDLPQRLKDAAEKLAAETDVMADVKVRAKARKEMIDDLIKSNIDPNVASNSIDMLLGLNITKNINEIHVTDLDKVVGKVTDNPELAAALAAALAGIISKGKDK